MKLDAAYCMPIRVRRSEKEEKSGSRRGASLCEPRELLKFEPGSGDSDDVGRLGPLLSLRDFKLDQPPLPNRGRQIRAWVRYFGGENSRQELPNAGECTNGQKLSTPNGVSILPLFPAHHPAAPHSHHLSVSNKGIINS